MVVLAMPLNLVSSVVSSVCILYLLISDMPFKSADVDVCVHISKQTLNQIKVDKSSR